MRQIFWIFKNYQRPDASRIDFNGRWRDVRRSLPKEAVELLYILHRTLQNFLLHTRSENLLHILLDLPNFCHW